jgi:hypothetical protein
VPIATGLALGIGGALAAGGSIAGSAIGANAAGNAASTQANAAEYAAQLQNQQAQQALQFQEQVYAGQQQNIAPWLQSGAGALSSLDQLLGVNPQTPGTGFSWDVAHPGQDLNIQGNNPGAGYTGTPIAPSNAFAQQNTPQQYVTDPISGRQSPLRSATYSGAPASTSVPLNSLTNPPTGSDLIRAGTFTSGNPSATLNAPLNRYGINTNQIGIQAGAARGGQTGQPASGLGGLPNPITGLPRGATPAGAPTPGGTTNTGAPLSNLLGGTPTQGGLLQGWNQQFQAPTAATEQNDPGYQFRLQQGLQALENSAAAQGGLLSGNTGQALEGYAQNYASGEYNNVYNRALQQYQQNYNIFQQNQNNQFNRLAALSGIGQTAAGQLNSAGQGAAGNVGNILLNSGQQIGNAIQNAGAATASGYIGGANAITGGLSGATGALGQNLLLSSLLGNQGGGAQYGVSPTTGAFDPNFNPYES